jgi:hypothetical protein
MVRTNALIRTIPYSFANVFDITLPAQPIYFLIKAGNSNIMRFHIHLHHLARSVVRVAKSFLPTVKPFLFDCITNCSREVIFHITFLTNSCSKHGPLFGHVVDMLACRALNTFKERALVAVWSTEASGALRLSMVTGNA